MPNNAIDESQPEIYTVSQLNTEVKFILEDTYPHIWVEGEISNFAAPNSGHWYFSLKDQTAQVRCAMFRGNQRKLTISPKDGMHVLIKARVSLYENRGEFQLIAENMEERGEGKLQKAFEQLKKKLAAANLFAEQYKKPLPTYPKQIGVITSPTGAAIRDILTVLQRRHPIVPVIIYPTLVQGTQAAPAIVKAITTANSRNECDVLILARGGGSLEDLWPFNEEQVAYAIFQSNIPIISGVGHEIDFTIADFVADQRAPTPSAAAELVTPDREELLTILLQQSRHLSRQMSHHLHHSKQQVGWLQKHLSQQHPKRQIAEKMQRLDYSELSFIQTQQRMINTLRVKLNDLNLQMMQHAPQHKMQAVQIQLTLFQQKINNVTLKTIHQQKTILIRMAAKLDTLSPLATLQRGFAMAFNHDKHILRDANEVKAGEEIEVRLARGKLSCQVKQIHNVC